MTKIRGGNVGVTLLKFSDGVLTKILITLDGFCDLLLRNNVCAADCLKFCHIKKQLQTKRINITNVNEVFICVRQLINSYEDVTNVNKLNSPNFNTELSVCL